MADHGLECLDFFEKLDFLAVLLVNGVSFSSEEKVLEVVGLVLRPRLLSRLPLSTVPSFLFMLLGTEMTLWEMCLVDLHYLMRSGVCRSIFATGVLRC